LDEEAVATVFNFPLSLLPRTAIARAASSEPVTAEALFHAYAAFAWRVLRRLGVREADADDVCQEVFVIVHRRIPEYEPRSSPRAWLYAICVRVAADYRKRAHVRREVCSEPPREPAIEAAQEDDVALRQAREVLDRLLDELDDDKRAVFVLHQIEELAMKEVAAALGCPLQTAYSRLHAAQRELDGALRRLRAKEQP
jgi:RNA polymerase sigma-70 factor (ECF subfamily)